MIKKKKEHIKNDIKKEYIPKNYERVQTPKTINKEDPKYCSFSS